MSIAFKIKQSIEKIPAGEPFSSASLRHLGTADTIRKNLGRLVATGKLERLANGLFVRVNNTSASSLSIMKMLEALAKKTGETISIHGAEAARRLQLTTQVPLKTTLYTTGRTREIKLQNKSVFLQHVSPKKIVAPGTISNMVLSALWYLGRNNVSEKTLNSIYKRIGKKEFIKILNYIENMPVWMANNFYKFIQSQPELNS